MLFCFWFVSPPINSFDDEAYGQGAHKYYIDYEDRAYFIQTEMDGGWEIFHNGAWGSPKADSCI